MLQAIDINKNFGRLIVLQNASLKVENEIKALIGINGSGKSTFLKIIAGIVPADGGQVLLNGRNIIDQPPENREVGYVPQHPALFRHLSVKENILYGMRNGKGSLAAFEQIVELLGLENVLEKRPRTLSGGYQSRTALARALVPQPRILLMDEPLSSMDVVLKEKILPDFRTVIKKLDIPVLYVTHDPWEAELLADNYAIIDDGQIKQVDTSREAFDMIRASILKNYA
jgi:molybdate/tungstate transport system ATP-binding protein